MESATLHDTKARQQATYQSFTPLAQEQRTHVDTATAAHHLSRKPQTLREWAITGHPIMPRRINGRLGWPTAEIRRLLGVL